MDSDSASLTLAVTRGWMGWGVTNAVQASLNNEVV